LAEDGVGLFADGKLMEIDILIYVEDPGAANFVAGLPEALEKHGWQTRLLADGFAYQYLLDRGIRPELVSKSENSARELLTRLKPGLVIVGTSENPETLGFDLITAARTLGIMTLGVVDAFGNADYRFRGHTDNPLFYSPEWIAVPDQWTKEAYVDLGYPVERLAICGHPHYDYVLNTAARLAKQDKQRSRNKLFSSNHNNAPVIVFAAEVSTGLNPGQYRRMSDYTMTGRGTRTNRTEIILEEFLDALALCEQKYYTVLRMHPKNTEEELAPFLKYFNQISQEEPSLALVFAADLVVGMTSMLMMEAAIMGRPTLSIVPREVEKVSLPTIRLGITPCVTTREELRTVLPDLLARCKQPMAVDTDHWVHPGSLQRTVGFIEGLLNGHYSG
jgi:hypothetical protein